MNGASPAVSRAKRSYGELAWCALLTAIFALAAGLRFHHLGARSFWYDEGMSVAYAELPLRQFFALLWRLEINMGLYYAILRGWLAFGHGETSVRALSAIAGVLTVPAVFALGRRLFDRPTGALAALLLALNAFAVRYSQEARGYALVALLLAMATLLFLRALEQPTNRAWNWYVLCAAAAVYAHLFAVLAVAAHALWLVATRPGWWRRKQIRRAAVLLSAALLPMAVFALHAGTEPIIWVRPTSWPTVREFVVELCGNSAAAAAACVLLWIAGIALSRREEPERRRAAGLIWLWLLLPPVVVLLVSLVRPIFYPRYLFVCVPAAALATAYAVRALPQRALQIVAAAVVTVLVARSTPTAFSEPMGAIPQDFRSATAYVLQQARPGDTLFFFPASARGPYDVYRDGRAGPDVIFPANRPGREYLDYVYRPLAGTLPDDAARHPRVFFFFTNFPAKGHDLGEDVVRAWLAHRYRAQDTAHFTNIEVITFTR